MVDFPGLLLIDKCYGILNTCRVLKQCSLSVKSASVISEEGFQLEEEEDSDKQSPTLAASSKRACKTASLTTRVSSEDIAEDMSSVSSTPKLNREKGNSQSLSKKLGNKMLKQPGSMRRKGRSFLTSLENMMQKSAARRAAACLEKEAEVQSSSGNNSIKLDF